MSNADRMLEAYLADLRSRLRALPEGEAEDVVRELRAHVIESAERSGTLDRTEVASVLERLGAPEELAPLYLTDRLLARAERSNSPALLLQGLFRWATISVAGALALAGLLMGYLLSGSFAIAALMKPIAPERVGLFRLPDGGLSLHLGFIGGPVGEELLGWSLVPLGLLIGAAGFWLTTALGRACIRQFRRGPGALHS